MAFKYTPYSEKGETKATTSQGGGTFKYKSYSEKPSYGQTLDSQLPAREQIRDFSKRNVEANKFKAPSYLTISDRLKMEPQKGAVQKVGEMVFDPRGYSQKQLTEAKPTIKEKAVGVGKYAGELATGVSSLSSMGLRKVPGLRWLAAEPEEIQKVSEWFKPKTAGEAKVMWDIDFAGTMVPVAGQVAAGARVGLKTATKNFLKDIAEKTTNSLANNKTGVRDKSLEFFKENPDQIKSGEVRLRELEDGSIVIEDGRHRLQAGMEQGVSPKIIDVTSEYTGKPSTKVQEIIDTQKKLDAPLPGAQDIKPSRTPSKGADPRTTRFAEGADTMFDGVDVAKGSAVTARSTAALARQADDIIKNSDEATILEVANRRDDLGTAVAAKYLNDLAEQTARATGGAKIDLGRKAAELVQSKAERLVEAGREIQAASLLGRMTPEGQLAYVTGEILRFNRKNPNKKVPNLTPEQSSEILSEMDEIGKMANGTEKQARFFKLQRRVQEMIPTGNLKKLTTLWKAGLLTGIKTLGLNLFSNVSHFGTELVKDIPAAAADSVISLLTGKRTTVATFRGVLDGLREGTVKGKRYFIDGFDERNIGQKLDYTRVNFGKGKIGKAMQVYTDQVFQTVGAGDQPFYYATLSKSYMNQGLAMAKNEGLKGKAMVKRAYEIVENPTEEMMEYAVRDAATAVFTQETYLGKQAKKVQQLGDGAGEFVVPFGRTPSAVATQIMNYTPVGAVAEAVSQIKKGKFDQRLLSQAIGRSTVGTVPMVIGWELAGQGLVSLDYPVGDSRQIELDKAEGVEYNSIKIGDEWRNPITLGPAGNLILFGAHMRNAIEKHGSNTKGIATGALGLLSSFTEQTFLTGFENFTKLLFDPVGQGVSTFQNFIASFVPTIVSDVARATDTVERRADTLGERVSRRVPGLRQNLEPNVDVLGREQAIAGRGGEILPDFVESMVDPTRPSQDISTSVTKEMSRLQDLSTDKTGSDYNVVPTRSGLYNYDVLTDAQETNLQKTAGSIINDKLQNLFLRPEYQKASDENKADIIRKITKQSKDAARARMVLEIIQSLPPEKRKSALVRMYQDKLITRDVERILEGG